MKCPIDNTDLQMTERQSVEIDYCPKCRGIWLDRGELDKIIERVGEATITPSQVPQMPPQGQQPYSPYDKHGNSGYYGKHGRRKGLLGELFDF